MRQFFNCCGITAEYNEENGFELSDSKFYHLKCPPINICSLKNCKCGCKKYLLKKE